MFEDIIVHSLIIGSTYALMAIGFSLIFGVARIINLTYTAFSMLAAYFIYGSLHYLKMWPPLTIILPILAVTFLGVLNYKYVIKLIQEHEAAVLIATLAFAMILQEVLLISFGGNYLGVPPLIDGYVNIAGVKVNKQYLLTFVVALIVMVGVWVLLMKTKMGLAIRATAQDMEMAYLMGINVNQVITITVALSIMVAAITGAIVAPVLVIEPQMWIHPLITIMAIVILGGLGSLKGSFVGAFTLGFTESTVVFLIPMGSFLKSAMALSIMVIVLFRWPQGLFGIVFEEER